MLWQHAACSLALPLAGAAFATAAAAVAELWWLPLPATDFQRENIRYSASQTSPSSSSSQSTRTPPYLYLSLSHDFGLALFLKSAVPHGIAKFVIFSYIHLG